MSILVFDIETVPDIEAGKRLYELEGIAEEDIEKAMVQIQAQKTGQDFLPLYLHRIVAISLVKRDAQGKLRVGSLGKPDSSEAALLTDFYALVDKIAPQLVSWNGGGFDLPVMHYRALRHGIVAKCYWDRGGPDNRKFLYNNYLSRYHTRHLDLMDVLASYNLRAAAPLEGLSQMLGFPGKQGLTGAGVAQAWREGRVDDIRCYCESDVLNTYLVFLRFELFQGDIDEAEYEQRCESLRNYLSESDRPHWHEFVAAWKESQLP